MPYILFLTATLLFMVFLLYQNSKMKRNLIMAGKIGLACAAASLIFTLGLPCLIVTLLGGDDLFLMELAFFLGVMYLSGLLAGCTWLILHAIKGDAEADKGKEE